MNIDTSLQLGDVLFSRYEVPEKITFGGEQMLAMHKLIGGARIIDSMGRDDMPLSWNGWFIGSNAYERARFIDAMRVGGKSFNLSFAEFNYQVVIKQFEADFERFYKLPYKIVCEVIADNTQPVTTTAVILDFDETISADIASADAIASVINDAQLTTNIAALDTAIKTVSTFANAVQSQINSVLVPLAVVQARVKILIASAGNVLSNVATLGGILPNNPVATQVAAITGQIKSSISLPQLYNLNAVLGRIGGNLVSILNTGKTIAVAGADLYHLATVNYGDPMAWTTIANANKLTDPVVIGVATLRIPPVADGLGGVLKT